MPFHLADALLILIFQSHFWMQYLITHFSDFQLACLGSFFLHESVFFLSGLPFIFIERAGWLSKYKIQVCRLSFLVLSRINATLFWWSQLWISACIEKLYDRLPNPAWIFYSTLVPYWYSMAVTQESLSCSISFTSRVKWQNIQKFSIVKQFSYLFSLSAW